MGNLFSTYLLIRWLRPRQCDHIDHCDGIGILRRRQKSSTRLTSKHVTTRHVTHSRRIDASSLRRLWYMAQAKYTKYAMTRTIWKVNVITFSWRCQNASSAVWQRTTNLARQLSSSSSQWPIWHSNNQHDNGLPVYQIWNININQHCLIMIFRQIFVVK